MANSYIYSKLEALGCNRYPQLRNVCLFVCFSEKCCCFFRREFRVGNDMNITMPVNY